MLCFRQLVPLGVAVALVGCAAVPAPPSPIMVTPGSTKTMAEFQQDDVLCRQHAAGQTGYGTTTMTNPTGSAVPGAGSGTSTTPSSGSGANKAANPPLVGPPNEIAYVQCMAARGDVVQLVPSPYADYGDPYAFGYPYDYGPYADYYDGFIGFYGWSGGYGGGYGFRHRGFGRWGSAHAGWGHGGWGHGGWGHGGWGHGGWGHGGGRGFAGGGGRGGGGGGHR